jgi:putative ABC transport system permease protein
LIRAGVDGLDSDSALSDIGPLEDLMTQSTWGSPGLRRPVDGLCIRGVALAAVGLYAVTAYAVVQRTQEIGVRMALGAEAGAVVWLFVRLSLLPLGIGLGFGMAGALRLGRLLQKLLDANEPNGPDDADRNYEVVADNCAVLIPG